MSSMSLSLIVNLIANTQSGVSKVTNGLEKIQRKAQDIRQGFIEGIAPAFTGDQFERNINQLDQRVDKARSRLMGAFAQGVALFAPVKMAANFDQAFRGVQKVLNDVPADKVEQLRKFLLNTSALLPVSAANLSELMGSAIQFGIPLEQVERFTLFTAKAAVAFDMAAGEIGKRMAKLANVYKLNQDAIEDLGDATNHLANNMAAEASEILDFTNRAASAANIFKMTAVEMAGLGGAMIAAGIQPEIAARGMNAMSNNILAGGKKVEAGFKQLGISRSKFLKEMGTDGEAAFMKLMGAAAKSPKGMEALINIVGKDFADDFGKLISNMELFNTSLRLLSEDRAGSVVDEYKALADGANEQWKLLLNKLSRAAIILGNQLLPQMLKFGDMIGKAVDRFAEFSTANPELVGWLVQGTASLLAFGIATRLMGFAWAVASRGIFGFMGLFFKFTEGGKNIAIMARAFRALGFLLSPIAGAVGLLKAGLVGLAGILASITWPVWALGAALAAVGVAIYKYWVPIREFFSGFASVVGNAIASVLSSLSGFGSSIVTAMGLDPEVFNSFFNAARAAFERFKTDVGSLFIHIGSEFSNWVSGFFSQSEFSAAAQAEFRSAGEKAGEYFINSLTSLPKRIISLFSGLGGKIVAAIGKIDLSSAMPDWMSGIFGSEETKSGPAGASGRKARRGQRNGAAPIIYDPASAGSGGSETQQKIDAKISAAVIDKRPPNVHVNAPITIHEASNPGAVARVVRNELSSAVSGSKAGALHDGVD